jgi:glycosyltransferase involved in cell wall biosynthesis
LLPVYNGARYLSEQVDSILAQEWSGDQCADVRVVILCRDDVSSDGSPGLLRDYAQRYPDIIRLIHDDAGNLGAAGNFSALMHHAIGEAAPPSGFQPGLQPGPQPSVESGCRSYFALADQDDIWRADKLQRSMTALLAAEAGDTRTPVLVHSDLRVVDAGVNSVADSFMAYQGLRPARSSLSAQLLSNTLTGCTAMMNLALLRKALPIPAAAVMHDWWLSLIASAFGRRVYLDEPLVDYRQHDSNTIGARYYTRSALSRELIRELFKTQKSAETQKAFEDIAAQAEAFVHSHGNEISVTQRFIGRRIIALPGAGVWRQRLLFRLLRLL